VTAVVERQQLLAQMRAVGEAEIAHAADLVGRLAVLDTAFGDRGMPLVVRVEVADERPHVLDRRIDDGAADDGDHGVSVRFRVGGVPSLPKSRQSAIWAPSLPEGERRKSSPASFSLPPGEKGPIRRALFARMANGK
jgi:hypothetical protein